MKFHPQDPETHSKNSKLREVLGGHSEGLTMAVEFLPLVVSFLPWIVPFSVYVLTGIISLYLYTKMKKRGFMLIGVGFLANAVAPLVRIALGGPFLTLRLYESGLSDLQISLFLFYVTLVDWAFLAIFVVLVTVGLFQLGRKTQT